MSDTTLFSRSAVGAVLLVLASVGQSAVPLGMEVYAIVERGDGKPSELRVADGGVLRSGDRLQVRVRAARDGYVYVVAYGSSGSALLLHPFSGRTETARVRADQEMVVPAEGIYLPLDARPGREALFAIWSQAPLQGINGLLLRMEGAGGDAEIAEQILRGAYPDAQRVAFRHLDSKPLYGVDLVSTGMAMQYRATGTIAPLEQPAASTKQAGDPYAITSRPVEASGGATLDGLSLVPADPLLQPSGVSSAAPAVSAEPDLDALLLEPEAEQSVLGGSGSRLRAFEAGQPTEQPAPVIVEPGASLQISPQTIGPGAPPQPKVLPANEPLSLAPPDEAAPVPETPPSGSGLTAAIAALFGGGASSSESAEAPPSAALDEDASNTSARVLPLADDTPVSGSSPLLELQVPAAAVTGGAAEPSATGFGVPAASSPAADTASAATQTRATVDAAQFVNVQAPDPSELGMTVRPIQVTSPEPSTSAAPAASMTPPASQTVEPAASLPATGNSSPVVSGALSSLFDAGRGASTTARPASTTVTSAGAAAPSAASIGPAAPASPAAPADAAASDPSSSAALPMEETGSAAASADASAATGGSSDGANSQTASSPVVGLFGAIAGFLGSSSPRTTTVGRNEDAGIRRVEAPQSDTQAGEPDPEETLPGVAAAAPADALAAPVGGVPVPVASTRIVTVEKQSEAAPAPPEAPVARATADEAVAAAPAASASAEDATSGGLFTALGDLFGFDGDRPPSTQASGESGPAQAPATGASAPVLPTGEPAATTEAPRPALNIDKEVVVRLDGPVAAQIAEQPQVQQQRSGAVLAEQGSRIRALLGETPPPEPVAPVAAAPMAVMAGGKTVPATEKPVADPATTRGRNSTAAATAPIIMSTAAAPAPTLTASVSAPATSVSVAPPLPGLAAGGAVTAPLPQLATMSTAGSIESARRVARGVVMVVTPEGSGSGALVDGLGHVVTNWHLVGGYSAVTVLVKDASGDVPARERPIRATVVRFSKFADLALLKLDSVPDTAAPLALGDGAGLREGSMLHAIGHPNSNAWSHTPIIVTRVREQGSWYSGQNFLYKAAVVSGQAHTDPGADGAALLDADMRLVALGATATRRGDKVQAVSVDTIRSFLQGNVATTSVVGGG